MRVFAICRGTPGLGRVVPSVGLSQTLARIAGAETLFASYSAGYAYLAGTGHQAIDLGMPDGLFIDSVAPQALRLLEVIEQFQPDLVLIDGEFFLPVALAHLPVPVVYLANPHDLTGPANTFRRVNHELLSYADAVIVSSLDQTHPAPTIPSTPCVQVRTIVKEFTPAHRRSPQTRVLISMGGGSLKSDPTFRAATDTALAAILTTTAEAVESGTIDTVTVVLGADGHVDLPDPQNREWLTIAQRPVELTSLYADHDIFIARAGRNATAEALYCGIPTVLVPVTADRHRASEQADNATAVTAPHLFPVTDWRQPQALREALGQAITQAARPRQIGQRGNEDAARFLGNLLASHAGTRPRQGTRT